MKLLKFLLLCLSILVVSCKKNKSNIDEMISQNKNNTVSEISDITDKEDNSLDPIIVSDFNLTDLFFYNIQINDCIESVKEKLKVSGKELSDGTDYVGVYKIWNKDMILEEGINLGFIACCYKNQIVSFTKYELSLNECQEIIDRLNVSFNLSKLQCDDIINFIINDWTIMIYKNQNSYTYCIYNNSLSDELEQLYFEYEMECDRNAEKLE